MNSKEKPINVKMSGWKQALDGNQCFRSKAATTRTASLPVHAGKHF